MNNYWTNENAKRLAENEKFILAFRKNRAMHDILILSGLDLIIRDVQVFWMFDCQKTNRRSMHVVYKYCEPGSDEIFASPAIVISDKATVDNNEQAKERMRSFNILARGLEPLIGIDWGNIEESLD